MKPVFSCGDLEDFKQKDFCVPEFNLSNSGCEADSLYQEEIMEQAMTIASAPINVFPLLGVSNQGAMIDPFEHGYPISNSTNPKSNVYNAFNTDDYWESNAKGEDNLNVYIGYCFGTKKNKAFNERYSEPAPIITAINQIYIEQKPNHEASQIRIDSSMDGIKWDKVDVITIKENQNTYQVRQSPKANMFRIVPIMYMNDNSWIVNKLQFIQDTALSLDTIQDNFFNENRDREYSRVSVCMRGLYDLIDSSTELSIFGIELPERYTIKMTMNHIVMHLGRPIVVGDIIELPSEVQYDHKLKPVRKWLEVIDVSWDIDGTTIDWKRHMVKIVAGPLLVSQENSHLLGNNRTIMDNIEETHYEDRHINMNPFITSVDIQRTALDAVPQTGTDTMDIISKVIDEDGKEKQISFNDTDIYISDAMPPNNLPYEEGYELPTSAYDGDYFRLKYEDSLRLPTRLYKYNGVKQQWIHVETQGRRKYISHKPIANILLSSEDRKDLDDK